jgi:hypothetical protein
VKSEAGGELRTRGSREEEEEDGVPTGMASIETFLKPKSGKRVPRCSYAESRKLLRVHCF